MDAKNKTAYMYIALSVLPVVVTLAGGFIAIANRISVCVVTGGFEIAVPGGNKDGE
jgi:hypothetical protein